MFGFFEEPTQVEGHNIDELWTTDFDDIGDQSIEPPNYLGELGNPWGNPHCLQSAIPRAFGFFTVMYCLTRMGRWKRARRRMSMIVYRGFYDKIIPFYFNKYRIRRKRRFQVQSKWFVSWQLLPCFWAFLWPQGFWHGNPRTNYANFTIVLAPLLSRPRIMLRAWRRPRLLMKPIVAGLIIGMLFAFFRSIFSVFLYLSRTYSGFWRPIIWEQQFHKKKILKRTSAIWTKQAQHRARLQGAYEILSNPATNFKPAIALPTAAELAQRAADVPLIDDSVKYGKDVSDFVPDAVLTFRQFLQTAQDTVKDLAVNPYTPPPSSKLSKGSVLRKEDVETYFMEAWEEDVQYRPAFPPPSPAILVPTRGGRWTPEPPQPYTFLDKMITQPDSLKGENWPQNINDWKSATDYRVFERRSARHLYDDWSRYHQMEGGLYDIDNELYTEPRFPRIPDLQYLWVKRFADQYWSPEDDWVFTDEEYAESVKKRKPVL